MLKLQRKVQRLQEELTDKLRYVRVLTAPVSVSHADADGIYRSTTPLRFASPFHWHDRLEVQGATLQLNLTKEIQDLFQKWQAARAECVD